MKRYILWAMFALAAIAVALFPSDPALAEDWAPIELVNPGAEPGALGHATLTNVVGPGWRYEKSPYYAYELYAGDLSVDCGGLTPGKTYRLGPTVTPLPSRKKGHQKVEYYTFTASADGGGGTAGTPVRVQFYVTWARYYDPTWGYGSWYRISADGYGFGVARKVGKSWTDSLTGFFPKPNLTYPPW